MASLPEMRSAVLDEIGSVLNRCDEAAFERFCATISSANRVACFGLGREGLALRAFCMRLMHMGFDTHMAGYVTAQPVAGGDVVLVTSGPGDLTLARSMIGLARKAGATVVVVTAQPDGPDPRAADLAVTIHAQTMADDASGPSVLAMGTAFELAMAIYFDLCVIRIRELRGESLDTMRARHFNQE
jgi:6-phospho-3-hexuloisomerase